MEEPDGFRIHLEQYLEFIRDAAAKHLERNNGHDAYKSDLSTMEGPKYIRVVVSSGFGSSRSVHSFVDRATGNIHKPAGWKGPLTKRGVRGNIFNPPYAVDHYGTHYINHWRAS
jgi:hypothetical protein